MLDTHSRLEALIVSNWMVQIPGSTFKKSR